MNTIQIIYTRSMLMFVALLCGITMLFTGCKDSSSDSIDGVEITSLQPVRGEAGDTVRIHGVGFAEFSSSNSVYFNGQKAVVDTVNEDRTMLTTRVPSAATTGPVSVAVDGETSQGGLYFNVIQPALEPEPQPRQVYWTGQTRSGEYVIKTTYMNSSGNPTTETVYTMETGFSSPIGVAIDLSAGHIYIADSTGYVGRASLDGSSSEIDTLYSGEDEGVTRPMYLALDLQNDYIYWTDTDRIMRGPLNPDPDTLAGETVYTVLTTPSATNEAAGMVLDASNNNLYWTERGDETRVQKGYLDGNAQAETLYGETDAQPEIDYIWNMTVDPASGHIYVSDRDSDHYSRIMIGNDQGDGFLKTALYGSEEGVALSPLAVDGEDGYLYWSQSIATDQLTRIMRARLMDNGVPGAVQVAFDNAALDDVEVIYSIAVAPPKSSAKAKGAGASAVQLHF